ncbi:MAG: hypothetical protein S4CHLAM2_13640 [Chlamydiales bacterium]|nr:hypothetical protein [Chlamydiales bacterium]
MTASAVGQNSVVYEGQGVPFETAQSEIGQITSVIFSQTPPSSAARGILNRRNVRNVFHQTSPEYLQSFRTEMQRILIYAFDHKGNIDDETFSLFVHHALSLLPFAYPEEGFQVQIPVKNRDSWELAPYTLDRKFNLGSSFFASPMPAFGFTSDGYPPKLIFMGTTYPAGQGFLGTLLSDFTPFASVGWLPMRCGREELGAWLTTHSGAHVSGISLGGSLSLHAAKNFGNHISKVFAFIPAGLNSWELSAFDDSQTEINILFQGGDLVSHLGFFPEGNNVNLYHVHEEQTANFLSAHVRVLLSGHNIRVERGSTEDENQRIPRKILTGLHILFTPLIFLLMLPAYLVVALVKALRNALQTNASADTEG